MSVLKKKILNTAIELFQSQGINATGVDTIVAKAGTTKMTLYKHYGSKENLILEVLKKTQGDFQAWLDSKLKQQSDQKIQALFDFIEEWINSPDFLGVGFIKASAEFPQEDNPIHQLSSAQSQSFKDYITQLATEANIQHADGLALQLAILFEGAVQAEQMQRGSGAIKYAKMAAKTLIDNATQSNKPA